MKPLLSTNDADYVVRILKHRNLECMKLDALGKITSVLYVGNAFPKPTKKNMRQRSTS